MEQLEVVGAHEVLVEAGYSAVFLENDGVAPFTEFIEAPKRAELVA